MRLAEGLTIPLSDLVALDQEVSNVSARMTVSRRDDVTFRSTPKYDIGALAADLLHKRMTPLIERVRVGVRIVRGAGGKRRQQDSAGT